MLWLFSLVLVIFAWDAIRDFIYNFVCDFIFKNIWNILGRSTAVNTL